jgi:YVTN family beta-propeller protein
MRMTLSCGTAGIALLTAAAMQAAGGARMLLYVDNSQGDDLTVIDMETLKPLGAIKVGNEPHGLCAPAGGRRLFVTIESEKNLKAIDTLTGRILDTIPVTGRPNQCAATPDGRFVGVPIRDSDSLDVVDTVKKKVVKVLPVKEPHNCFNAFAAAKSWNAWNCLPRRRSPVPWK